MSGTNLAIPAGNAAIADVGTPQVVNLVRMWCPCPFLSDKVTAGHTVSAVFSNLGRRSALTPTLQKKWSRGCRISDVSFWSWQWPQSLQLARPKHPSPHRKSPSSRRIPASTSNISTRVRRHSPFGPASDFGLPLPGCRPEIPKNSLADQRHPRAIGPIPPAFPADCPARSLA